MKRVSSVCLAMMLAGMGSVQAATWTTLDKPGALGTYIRGIDGGNFVGYYHGDDGKYHGFFYNGTSWATLDAPGGTGHDGTHAYGIDGSNVVGRYYDNAGYTHGFLYNLTDQSWTDLPIPAGDIDGDNIVGGNQLYNMTDQTITTLNKPGAAATNIWGIDGGNIVGFYQVSSPVPDYRGFIYNGTTWTTLVSLDLEGNPSPLTYIYDIEGSNLVGWSDTTDGFLYNGTTWTSIHKEGAVWTRVWGIEGSTLVGDYKDASNIHHGFIYEIPEPASAVMLAMGTVLFRLRRRQGRIAAGK